MFAGSYVLDLAMQTEGYEPNFWGIFLILSIVAVFVLFVIGFIALYILGMEWLK
jgi:hypothetical protein